MYNKTDRGKENLVKKLKLQCKNVQNNKNLKSARGITLVALVITIIIIIILATITMNMAFGDNGLIKQAQKAKDMAANSVIAEQEGINSLMGEFANTMENEIDNPTEPDPDEPDPEPGPGEEIPEGTITFGEVVWSGYRASVEVKSSAVSSSEQEYTIQYQVNGTTENRWYTINNGASVENLYHGDKVYARLTDGEKASQAQEKQVLDTKAPAKATIELSKENLIAGENLTAKVTHIDNESGVDLAQSKWTMNQTASEIGTDAGSYTGTFSSNEETLTLDSKTTGEYYLHILTVDKGGNKTETISNKITIGNITGRVQQKGATTWSSGKASIELETTETQYTIEYKINSGSWTKYTGAIGNLNHGDKVTARLTNGTATGPETTIEIKDENNPVVIVTTGGTTTNSVTVSVSASDNESGMAENVTYTYYIKKTSEGDASYNAPNGATNISQTNYTFTNLDQGTSYDVKVEAKADKAGNIGTGSLPNQTTATIGGASEGLVEGNIVAGPVTWKNEKASTTLTTSTSLQIQYQINTTTEGNWQTISNGGTVGNLNHGDTVFARLYDGKNHGDYASVNILDGTPPTVQISVGEITQTSIAVSVTANDGQSGLATSNTYKYYLNDSLKKTTTATSYTFEGLTAETSYEIKVEAYDKANNKGTDTENVSTVKAPTAEETLKEGDYVYYTDAKGTKRKCVVLYDSSSEYGIEIITMNTVEDVTLGDSNDFTASMNSYNDVVSTLNSKAETYNNSIYSSYARSVGSIPNNPNKNDPRYFIDSYGYLSDYNGRFKNGDTNYEKDFNQMKILGITDIGKQYWLTSRYVDSYPNESYFRVRYVYNNVNGEYLCYIDSKEYIDSKKYTKGLRPIFHLKSNLIITGGNGTEEVPYELGVAKPESDSVESKLKEGDYVKYVDATGEERTCVVLYDASKYGEVQIITMDEVEFVTLGKKDTTATSIDDFTTAVNSYNSAVSTLNSKAMEYNNRLYSSYARSVGSNPKNPSKDDVGYFTSSESYMTDYNGIFKAKDNNYETDWNQMTKLDIENAGGYYWLATRNVESNSNRTFAYVQGVSSGGFYERDMFRVESNNNIQSGGVDNSIRPVFHLKSNVKVTGGSGTSGNPYTLGI